MRSCPDGLDYDLVLHYYSQINDSTTWPSHPEIDHEIYEPEIDPRVSSVTESIVHVTCQHGLSSKMDKSKSQWARTELVDPLNTHQWQSSMG